MCSSVGVGDVVGEVPIWCVLCKGFEGLNGWGFEESMWVVVALGVRVIFSGDEMRCVVMGLD